VFPKQQEGTQRYGNTGRHDTGAAAGGAGAVAAAVPVLPLCRYADGAAYAGGAGVVCCLLIMLMKNVHRSEVPLKSSSNPKLLHLCFIQVIAKLCGFII
jgi:hypothetical protein